MDNGRALAGIFQEQEYICTFANKWKVYGLYTKMTGRV